LSSAGKFDWSQRRILVIEDDAETLEKLRAIFVPLRLGALDVVRDGAQVLAAMKRIAPDLILMEANPGGMDGLDTLRAIRGKDSPNPDVIVAVMVAVADAERLRRMCGIGIESFIRKPVAADVLLQRVQGALVNPQRFISSLTYFGPDRRKLRRAGEPPHRGIERRRIVKTKEAPPPPRAVVAPPVPAAARRSDLQGGGSGWFEAPPEADKLPERENIPLVDDPAPKARPDNADAWAEAMAPEATPEEQEEAGFDVKTLVSSHSEWIASGGTSGAKASVENLDLSGANLAGVNLSGASLRNVRLSSANMRGAVLQSTDLRGSDLSGADLTDGDLTSSNMRRVDLSSATLANTKLAGTDLAGASLRGADLTGTDLQGANLLDADIAATDLSGATGLVQTQVNKARPNPYTVLPPGLRRPATE
jgi:CheY-like chemotaxis protein